MPDQSPPAPEGCVYGPWVGFKGRPFAVVEYVGRFSRCPAFKTVGFYDGSWDNDPVIGASERELLRLAKENAELKAENERLTSVIENSHAEWRMNAE